VGAYGHLIEAEDLNGLLRVVDELCANRDWDGLVELAERCEEALERGRQLWPIAAHIDYRLALEAPGEYAASVLVPQAGRFSLGPLTEVAASTHTWAELAPHIETPQAAAYVAQERVLRGEDLSGDARAHPEVLELPLALQRFEPTYALATYGADHVEVAEPWTPRAGFEPCDVVPAELLDEPELEAALLELVAPWVAESNGAARAVVVEGHAAGAIAHLAPLARLAPLEPAEALSALAWAGASGGAHGRRRGAAFGRWLAWSTVAALADLPWPCPPDTLGRGLGSLRWYRWDEGEPEQGWVLRIAAEDPEHGWAAALAATDVAGGGDS
jgi:hypothetical protein